MGVHQWIFHYKEIMKKKKQDVDIQKALLETISDKLDFVAVMVNPKALDILKELNEIKDNPKAKTEETVDELMEFFNEVKDEVPQVIEVEVPKENRFFLPKYKRNRISPGIQMKEGED